MNLLSELGIDYGDREEIEAAIRGRYPNGVARVPADDPCEACGHVRQYEWMPVHKDWQGLYDLDAQRNWEYVSRDELLASAADAVRRVA